MNGNLDKKNGFLYAKAAVAALCGAFTAAFGWLGWLVLTWAACMALDWLSGSAAAASRGEWSSAAARAGIWHKAGMVVVVCVAALTDLVGGGRLRSGADRLGFKRGGGKPAGVWGWCWV